MSETMHTVSARTSEQQSYPSMQWLLLPANKNENDWFLGLARNAVKASYVEF